MSVCLVNNNRMGEVPFKFDFWLFYHIFSDNIIVVETGSHTALAGFNLTMQAKDDLELLIPVSTF